MKKISLMIAGLLIASVSMFAADIDGKWTSEIAMRGPDGEVKVATTLDLKSSGDNLTGSVTTAGPRPGTAEIMEGKVTGNKFMFKTKQTTKKGESIMNWEGSVDGGTLTGSRMREGGNNKMEFTAKRAAS